MNDIPSEKTLSTADFAAVAEKSNPPLEAKPDSEVQANGNEDMSKSDDEEKLAPLFVTDAAADFRARWDAVQIGFVDDPRQAVRQADELVAQVMKSLAASFSSERVRIESQSSETDSSTTENLRVALRQYRSFFQRLLSL